MSSERKYIDIKIDTKIVISALWVTLMILYSYCDILSLFRPGQINDMIAGKMGFMATNQFSLVNASLLMIIPSIMIPLSLILKAKINRLLNMIVGILYFFVNIGNLISEKWVYYFFFGILEIAIILAIEILTIKWEFEKQ